VRIEVGEGDDRCEIDLAVDYRALPVEASRYGPTLAIDELAADKVLALFDRAEARDFLDLVALTRRFELRSMLALASEKDHGVDREGFRDALGSFERFTPVDLGVSDSEYEQLRATVGGWRDDLARDQQREPPGLGF
jgi:hypothetical protein